MHFFNVRNTDSHTCWSSVLLETQEPLREALTRRSSLRELESSHSLRSSTKTTLSQPDSWSTISTWRTSRKKTSRPLKPELPWKSNGEPPSAILIETSQTQRPTKRPHTLDSSTANSDSDLFHLFKHILLFFLSFLWMAFNLFLFINFFVFLYFLHRIYLFEYLWGNKILNINFKGLE